MTETIKNPLDTVRAKRRTVIAGAAAIAGAAGMSGLLPEALAAKAAADTASFDLSQVKHVVMVMQENRSFDHYFGTFPGVRGFDDAAAMTLANGNSVFQQPDPSNPDGYLEPFHMDTEATGAAAIPSLSHDWRDQHASWNQGAMDGWLLTHVASDGDAKGSYTMGYYTQDDIPFHWAVASNFTLCDNYHCSVMGPTYPNRAIWMSGTNDPQGTQGGPILETVAPNTLYWKSAPEVLYDAGYTVKTYTSSGSYNYFKSWWDAFKNYGTSSAKTVIDQRLYNLIADTTSLFGDGTPGGIGNPLAPTPASVTYHAFEEDCSNGVLADVTWLFPDGPYASDEHPPNTPAAGAYFLASKLEALASNDELWNSTVFIINYDENDGFFDHVPPPVPDYSEYPEEYVTLASPRGTPGGGLPVGAGFRVPCLIVSPWTVGGHVYSQVADHTSALQLIEAVTAAGGLNATPSTQSSGRVPVTFDAITRWRRTTFDDFSGVFRPAPQAAPSSPEWDNDAREANYEAQLAASSKPMPARPGATQTMPHQDGTATPSASSSPSASAAALAATAPAAAAAAGSGPSGSPATSAPAAPAASSASSGSSAPAVTGPVAPAASKVTVASAVRVGEKALVTVSGAKAGSVVVVRHAHGKVAARGHAGASGKAALHVPTAHMEVGRERFTVMYVDQAGHHHTRNISFKVTKH